MESVRSKDGTTIAYDTFGEGQPLIVVYGATCFRKFFPVKSDAKAFATRFKVYSYDRRGRGDSGDTLPYSIQKEIDDIEALADQAKAKVVLYGHSSGAALALEAALRFPDKIERVIIYDASYVQDAENKKTYEELIAKVSQIVSERNDAKALKTFLSGIGMPGAFVFLLPLFPGWKTMKALYPTLLYDMEITRDPPDLKKFSAIKVPVHIMYGDKNPASIPNVAEQLKRTIPGCKFTVMKGFDHMISAQKLLPLI
ncbi:MAG: alpha/beta hydrolase [Bdellovibrionota bacterium]